MEQTINQLLEMGGGNWDRETILHALRAAYNNPERAVEYLYSVCVIHMSSLHNSHYTPAKLAILTYKYMMIQTKILTGYIFQFLYRAFQ